MDVFHSYKSIGESRAHAWVEDVTPSIEVLPMDMDLLKEAARLHLKALKPTSRMEVVARAFGFRTAASLQTAIKTATPDCPLVLTPRIGPIDAYRLEQLAALSRDMKLGQTDRNNREPHIAFEQARDIAAGVVDHIRNSRGISDDFSPTSYSPRGRACVVHGLPGRRGHHIVEKLIPQIDLCLNPATSVRDDQGFRKGRMPTGSAIHLLGGVQALSAEMHKEVCGKLGVDPSRILPDARFDEHLATGTLVYESPEANPEAFMTVTFEQSFADEDSGRYYLEEVYGISDEHVEWAQLCEMAQAVTAEMWRLDVTIHDVGYAPGADPEVASAAIHYGLSQMINELLMSMSYTASEGADGNIEIGVEVRIDPNCKEPVEIWTINEDVAVRAIVLNDEVRDHDVGETEVSVRAYSEEADELADHMQEDHLHRA